MLWFVPLLLYTANVREYRIPDFSAQMFAAMGLPDTNIDPLNTEKAKLILFRQLWQRRAWYAELVQRYVGAGCQFEVPERLIKSSDIANCTEGKVHNTSNSLLPQCNPEEWRDAAMNIEAAEDEKKKAKKGRGRPKKAESGDKESKEKKPEETTTVTQAKKAQNTFNIAPYEKIFTRFAQAWPRVVYHEQERIVRLSGYMDVTRNSHTPLAGPSGD